MAACLTSNKFLIDQDYPMRNDLVEIIDSDEETDLTETENINVQYFTEENCKAIKENFADIFNDVMNKYNFETQVQYSLDFLKNRSQQLKGIVITRNGGRRHYRA